MHHLEGRVGDDLYLTQLERREDALLTASANIDARASALITAAALVAVQPAAVLVQQKLMKIVVGLEVATCVLTGIAFCLALLALGTLKLPAIGVDEEWRKKTLENIAPENLASDGPLRMTWGLILALENTRLPELQHNVDRRRAIMIWGRCFLAAAVLTSAWALFAIAATYGIF